MPRAVAQLMDGLVEADPVDDGDGDGRRSRRTRAVVNYAELNAAPRMPELVRAHAAHLCLVP